MAFAFSTFSRRVAGRARNVTNNADELVRFRTEVIHSAIVLATPVDTGLARGNWQVTLDAPANGVVTLLSPSGREAIEEGKNAINSYVGGSQRSSLYISNLLPYIVPLNEGHSKQAPVGFVETAIQTGIRVVPSGGGILTNRSPRSV